LIIGWWYRRISPPLHIVIADPGGDIDGDPLRGPAPGVGIEAGGTSHCRMADRAPLPRLTLRHPSRSANGRDIGR